MYSPTLRRARATRPHQAPSIPTKLQVVRHQNQELPVSEKAFGSRSQRFSGVNEDGNGKYTPGPGYYGTNTHTSAAPGYMGLTSPSQSRKGYGVGFVSKTKRFDWDLREDEEELAAGPGPGSYNTQAAEQAIRRGPRHNTSTYTKQNECSDGGQSHADAVAAMRAARARATFQPLNVPGPGAYETNKDMIDPSTTSRTYASTFKSARPLINKSRVTNTNRRPRSKGGSGKRRPRTKVTPAPGAYHHPIVYTKSAVGKDGNEKGTWAFSSSSTRGDSMLNRGQRMKKTGSSVHNNSNDAAGDSSPQHVYSVGRVKNSGSLMRGPIRRAVGVPKPDMLGGGVDMTRKTVSVPGPGTYNLSTRVMLSNQQSSVDIQSAFKSRTKRNVVSKQQRAVPGPAFYEIKATPNKRSFLLNAGRKWV